MEDTKLHAWRDCGESLWSEIERLNSETISSGLQKLNVDCPPGLPEAKAITLLKKLVERNKLSLREVAGALGIVCTSPVHAVQSNTPPLLRRSPPEDGASEDDSVSSSVALRQMSASPQLMSDPPIGRNPMTPIGRSPFASVEDRKPGKASSSAVFRNKSAPTSPLAAVIPDPDAAKSFHPQKSTLNLQDFPDLINCFQKELKRTMKRCERNSTSARCDESTLMQMGLAALLLWAKLNHQSKVTVFGDCISDLNTEPWEVSGQLSGVVKKKIVSKKKQSTHSSHSLKLVLELSQMGDTMESNRRIQFSEPRDAPDAIPKEIDRIFQLPNPANRLSGMFFGKDDPACRSPPKEQDDTAVIEFVQEDNSLFDFFASTSEVQHFPSPSGPRETRALTGKVMLRRKSEVSVTDLSRSDQTSFGRLRNVSPRRGASHSKLPLDPTSTTKAILFQPREAASQAQNDGDIPVRTLSDGRRDRMRASSPFSLKGRQKDEDCKKLASAERELKVSKNSAAKSGTNPDRGEANSDAVELGRQRAAAHGDSITPSQEKHSGGGWRSGATARPMKWKEIRYSHILSRNEKAVIRVAYVDGLQCVVKDIMLEGHSSRNRKKEREVEILSTLQPHPNIVRYLYHECKPDIIRIYLTRYTCSLSHRLFHDIDDHNDLRVGDAEADVASIQVVLTDVCKGLNFLHKNNVAHRDLKSDNILLIEEADGSVGLAAIADFDAARFVENEAGVLGSFIGTPNYFAPELAKVGKGGLFQKKKMEMSYSSKIDIWGVGLVLFEMLTISRPNCDPGKAPILPKAVKQSSQLKMFRNLYKLCVKVDPGKRPNAAELVDLLGSSTAPN